MLLSVLSHPLELGGMVIRDEEGKLIAAAAAKRYT
jgi:hypothetical protein